MKNTLVVLSLVGFLLSISSIWATTSPYNLSWTQTISTASDEKVYDVKSDVAGNLYVSGTYKGTLTLGATVLTNSGQNDIFIAKLNSQKQYLWAVKIGGTAEETEPYLKTTPSGDCIVTFNYSSSLQIGSTTLNCSGMKDIGVVKISGDGLFIWAIKGGGPFLEEVDCLDIYQDGTIYVCGQYGYYNNVNGVSAYFGDYALTTTGDQRSNIFLAKISPTGNWEWAVQVGGYEWDFCYGLDIDSDGLVYITGGGNNLQFGSTHLGACGFIACANSDGAWQWAKGLQGYGGLNVYVDDQKNVYVSGMLWGGSTVNFGPAGSYVTNGTDFGIAKLSYTHEWLWYKAIGGIGDNWAIGSNRGMTIDFNNEEIISVVNSGDTAYIDGVPYYCSAPRSVLTVGLDLDGNVSWVNQSGSTNNTDGQSQQIVLTKSNGILYVYGWSYNASFENGFETIPNSGLSDGYILELNTDADFSAVPLTGDVPLEVDFVILPTPSSSDLISWDFENDGIIDSQDMNPTHIYSHPGLYSVKLIIENSTVIDTVFKDNYINVTMPATPRIVAAPDTLHYGNVATNSTVSKPMNIYNWGGEDLEIYSISAANARYSITLPAGSSYPIIVPSLSSIEITVNFSPLAIQAYNTNLVIVSNDPDNGVLTKRLEGSGYILSANFSATPLSGDIPLLVQFNDMSQGDIVAHLWDFGDGNTSTELNPSHTYIQKGLYDVTLVVQDQYISRSITRPDYISAIAHPVIATPDSSGIEFGIVYLGDTGTHQLILQSAGTDTVFVASVGFYQPGSAYSVVPESIPDYILPGMQAILDVSFHPYQASTYNDTLYVYNSSENKPILKIKLRGIGEYVPPQTPQGVTIVIDGYDAVISWEAVTQNIYNTPITVPYYFIYGSLIPNPGPTEQIFIGYSTGTTFHHAGVNLPGSNVQPPPQYFYTVTAVVWYPPRNINIALDDLIGRTKEEVERQLR